MIEMAGNLWDWLGRAPLAVTTNGSLNRRGECSGRTGRLRAEA